MKAKVTIISVLLALVVPAMAQRVTLSQPHGYCDTPFTLSMAVEERTGSESWTIRYTTDSSTPTADSPAYTEPLAIKGSTIVRAAAFADKEQMTDITTATYLFGCISPIWRDSLLGRRSGSLHHPQIDRWQW